MSDRIHRQAPLLAGFSWGKGEFHTLYIRHQASLYRFSLRSLDDPEAAQELVFEVMCEAWSKGASGLRRSSLHSTRTHLLQIAYRKSCERCAERVVINPHTIAPERPHHKIASDPSDPSTKVEAAKDPERVRTCVAKLSQVERQVLHLTLCESMGDQTIAYIIDRTLDQVRKTMTVAEHNLMQGLSLPAEADTGDPSTDHGDTYVSALLPWYINGTLSCEECDTVEANLLRSSSLPQNLQVWQCIAQSLQAEPDNTAGQQGVLECLQTNFGTDLQSKPTDKNTPLFGVRYFRIARIVISVLVAIGLSTLLILFLLEAAAQP